MPSKSAPEGKLRIGSAEGATHDGSSVVEDDHVLDDVRGLGEGRCG
jgi:hypothetical protein